MSAFAPGTVFHGQKDMQESDGKLLTRFAKDRDDAAFNAITARYLGLIYHTALRRTGNRPMAEEVSQNVLCAVAKKALKLANHPERLPAWLHRATLFESSKAMRSEVSQQRRKQLRHPDEIAATGDDDAAWLAALPHLDPALDHLSDSDRRVVLQHYFEGLSFTKIAEQQGRPAATLQKQCRRAIDKLARMMRGKGVALTAGALASGLGVQLAKAAPVTLMKTAAGSALAGSSSYSTAQLTLFMAMKSKTALPLALLVLAAPLVVQQYAISRAADDNQRLRLDLAGAGNAVRPDRVVGSEVANAGLAKQTITIDVLMRARTEAQRMGALKQIEFDEMLASLDGDELAELIPQVFGLPVEKSKRSDLLRDLVGALAKIDPERAVRVTCSAAPGKPLILNVGVEKALHDWTLKSPDEAIAWLKDLSSQLPNLESAGKDSWFWFMNFQSALVGGLITERSPRTHEILTLVPDVQPHYLVRDAMEFIEPRHFMEPDAAVDRFGAFLPWLREFVPEEAGNDGYGRRQAIEGLLRSCNTEFHWQNSSVTGDIMDSVDLRRPERRVIAEAYALNVIENYYNTRPRPEREVVDAAARSWLEQHAPAEADAIFEEAKVVLHDREHREIKHSLQNFNQREVLRDDDLVRELSRRDFEEFPEFLPQALELAQKIKDPAKRANTIQLIEKP
ncbi:RNA polymerase sigma factor [Haloferula sp.]|uniref:RNA polymerase sigma factor n=1 Tax=Haloferula sp. TaxID=2497595 RepID=UPI00329E9B44